MRENASVPYISIPLGHCGFSNFSIKLYVVKIWQNYQCAFSASMAVTSSLMLTWRKFCVPSSKPFILKVAYSQKGLSIVPGRLYITLTNTWRVLFTFIESVIHPLSLRQDLYAINTNILILKNIADHWPLHTLGNTLRSYLCIFALVLSKVI